MKGEKCIPCFGSRGGGVHISSWGLGLNQMDEGDVWLLKSRIAELDEFVIQLRDKSSGISSLSPEQPSRKLQNLSGCEVQLSPMDSTAMVLALGLDAMPARPRTAEPPRAESSKSSARPSSPCRAYARARENLAKSRSESSPLGG